MPLPSRRRHAWSSSSFLFFGVHGICKQSTLYTKNLGSETEAESEDVSWLLVCIVRPMLKLLLVSLQFAVDLALAVANVARNQAQSTAPTSGQIGWFDLA